MKSGGLGTACYDLCRGLADEGEDVTFVVPRLSKDVSHDFVKLRGAHFNVKVRNVSSILTPYMNSASYDEAYKNYDHSTRANYGMDLMSEVARYSANAGIIAKEELHDVIHCHDWMTYEAGIIARKISGKPLVMHIHATEFDRTGGNPNHEIAHREYLGLEAADLIIANSEYTKQNVIRDYNISPDKIRVVHWGIDPDNPAYNINYKNPFKDDSVVLFLGRVTLQKGPEYFVRMAEKVVPFVPNVKFVFSGDGDKFADILEEVAAKGLSERFVFAGFLKGDKVHQAFQMADLFVMPSVSEPFGLVALESIKNGTPVLISKQSGVSEVLNHAFKVNFWDVDEMANKVVSFLTHSPLQKELNDNSFRESAKFNLQEPARKCIECYNEVIQW